MAKRGTSRGFLKAENKWTKETEQRSEDAFQNGIMDFYDALRAATPVDTGNLRDAWVVSKNGQAIQTVTGPGDSPNVSGNRSGIEQSLGTITNLKVGDRVDIMNQATYYRRLEYGFSGFDSLGRYYNQPGRFFAAQVGAKYRSIMRAAATRLRLASK